MYLLSLMALLRRLSATMSKLRRLNASISSWPTETGKHGENNYVLSMGRYFSYVNINGIDVCTYRYQKYMCYLILV